MTDVNVLYTPKQNSKLFIRNRLLQVIQDLENADSSIDRNLQDSVAFRLEQIAFICSETDHIWPEFIPQDDLSKITEVCSVFSLYDEETDDRSSLVTRTGVAGRPSLDIPKYTLETYLRNGFSRTKIAKILGTSRRTITRRIKFFGLNSTLPHYTQIDDNSLDAMVQEVFKDFPNCGIRCMKGFLLSREIRLQWATVRDAMWRVDPSGLLLRTTQLNTVQRRRYSVPGTFALWHIDGNHKLIRWGFVIHGCVDGYSRRVMFL